ncbi:hypothetical protein W822_05685 [Advenella kashmirensis W13003]|uniref:Uncharacterized protein n=1 Tax=Advenella kashmirensis W13003 TaxID=1424334 RepID=V8QUL5_9BURK|nr:hypothetical protein W822_05685 [Advenella kashmirensis W13003]
MVQAGGVLVFVTALLGFSLLGIRYLYDELG